MGAGGQTDQGQVREEIELHSQKNFCSLRAEKLICEVGCPNTKHPTMKRPIGVEITMMSSTSTLLVLVCQKSLTTCTS